MTVLRQLSWPVSGQPNGCSRSRAGLRNTGIDPAIMGMTGEVTRKAPSRHGSVL
jgi:hypothetical protein